MALAMTRTGAGLSKLVSNATSARVVACSDNYDEPMSTPASAQPPVTELGMPSVAGRSVLLAAPRGYCAGVDRAVITVEKALDLYGSPVYVRKQNTGRGSGGE